MHIRTAVITPFRLCVAALLVTAAMVGAAVAAQKASAAYFYCNEEVATGNWCPRVLQGYDYVINVNQAYVYHGDGLQVCEGATAAGASGWQSLQCGASPVDSGCDLLYGQFGPYVYFTFYTGNVEGLSEYMVGKGTHTTTVCA